MRGREGSRTNDDAGIRADLQPDFETIHAVLVENIKNIWMIKFLFIRRNIYDKMDTRVVHRRPKRCAQTGMRSGTAQYHRGGARVLNVARGGKLM